MSDRWKINVISGVPAGKVVPNGFANQTCRAPDREGVYTLVELVSEDNIHRGWEWAEGVLPSVITYEDVVEEKA